MPSITVPYHPGLTYGVGVDTPSGEARNIAATGSPSQIPNALGDITTFFMNQISSVEDLHTELGISASANGGFGLFSASGRFDYSKSCNIHSNSVFLIVKVSVLQAFSMINAPGIDAAAAKLIENGNMTRFQDQFGDMFVRGMQTGGLFFGVIQIITKDQTDKETIQAKVSASYAAFGANGSFNKDFQETLSTRQVSVKCYIEGGDRNKELPSTIEGLSQRATHFPGELSEGRGVPYAALLDSYSILPLPNPPNYIDLQHQKFVLVECARLRNDAMMMLNDIDYIILNANEFIDVEKFPLGQCRNNLNHDLNTIAAAASDALNNPKTAKVPDLLTGAIVLPQRKQAPVIPAGTMVTIPEMRGMKTNEAQARLAHLGLLCQLETTIDGNNESPPPGDVVFQSPPAGIQVPVGEMIVLTIEINAE